MKQATLPLKPPIQTIGLLFESEQDLMSTSGALETTHYHWRESEEVDAVASALDILGYTVTQIGSIQNLLQHWRQNQLPDFIWNLSVRAQSRNRTAIAPAILEQLGLPYTGGDAAVKALTLNKDWLKPVLQWSGIHTPPWHWYGVGQAITELPSWPVSILKPTCEGYSLGLIRFETNQGLQKLNDVVQDLGQQFQSPILCEPLIAGQEITVGVVGNDAPKIWGAIETITLTQDSLGERVLDLKAKRQGSFQKVSVDLSQPNLRPIRSSVLSLLPLMKPLDYATFDFRVAADGTAYLIDVNADATLHPARSLARVAKCAGYSYETLIATILKVSLHRWGIRDRNAAQGKTLPDPPP